MAKIWEIDFYSRPILDDNGKKIWELLVCESPQDTHTPSDSLFRYAEYCDSGEVNSAWLGTALQMAIAQSQQPPQKIRFFRRQMNNMITKGCADIGIPAITSRRTFALQQWLEERMLHVYPEHPNYQGGNNPSVQFDDAIAQPLPDALIGDKWSFVSLEATAFDDMSEWAIDFGEAFPLSMAKITPDTPIPGLIIYSRRSLPMAGWMSGIDPVFLTVESLPQARLILATGGNDSWILVRGLDQKTQAQALDFETAKKKANGVHFLAIQSSPDVESFAGFWLLKE
jgi:RNA-binding protein Tab2/Atab2